MSIIAMTLGRFARSFIWLMVATGIVGCTRLSDPDLPLGRPVALALGLGDARSSATEITLTVRSPGSEGWAARFARENGDWRIPSHQNDLADPGLLNHLLQVFETFNAESAAGHGDDATFGLNPFRFELRVRNAQGEHVLRLGDSAGLNGIYFRTDDSKKTWVGRGALVSFLPAVAVFAAFPLPSPYRMPMGTVRNFTLVRESGPKSEQWSFDRRDGAWFDAKKPLSDAQSAALERITRQRVLRILPAEEHPELKNPDWRLTVTSDAGTETLAVGFLLNSVFATNPARSPNPIELYPEMAGALRAFTQAGPMPRKSGTK